MMTPDNDMLKELAELKLQNQLLSQRVEMMTRFAARKGNQRTELCRLLTRNERNQIPNT